MAQPRLSVVDGRLVREQSRVIGIDIDKGDGWAVTVMEKAPDGRLLVLNNARGMGKTYAMQTMLALMKQYALDYGHLGDALSGSVAHQAHQENPQDYRGRDGEWRNDNGPGTTRDGRHTATDYFEQDCRKPQREEETKKGGNYAANNRLKE